MKTQKMKIAMIGQKGIPAIYGGVERHVEEISRRLVEKGHDVTVYSRPYYMKENSYNSDELNGVKIKVVPTIKSKHLDAIVHCFISSVDSIFKNYDIIHYHAIGPSTLSFLPRIKNSKSVVTVHGLDWQRKKWNKFASLFLQFGEKSSYYFPNKTIVVSKTLKKYYDGKYNADVSYIPNGVNLPVLNSPDIIKKKYNLDKDSYIVFISRLVPEKGCHYLIEAYKQIKTDKKLLIVGGSSHSDDYVKTIKEMARDDKRILFTGNVYGQELNELFSNAYIFILPSEMEGLPIVILEALSFGKCVLASDISENMEVIAPFGKDEYGFSFENKNIKSLREKIELLINNPENVESMCSNSIDYVKTNYNWDSVADQTEKIYLSMIK